jgi:hypothetical protein
MDWIIITNSLLVLVTGIYVILTFLILKSNIKIEKIRLDPILWINPDAEGEVFITKLKKYPAYNISFNLYIKFNEEKKFTKLSTYNLGSLIEEEETYDISIDEDIENYLKKINRVNSKFIIKYILEYHIGVDKKPIRRADILYYHSEEYGGQVMLGASSDKNPSFDGGKSPIKIERYF